LHPISTDAGVLPAVAATVALAAVENHPPPPSSEAIGGRISRSATFYVIISCAREICNLQGNLLILFSSFQNLSFHSAIYMKSFSINP